MRKLLSFLSIALMAIVTFGCEKPIEGGQTTGTTFTFGEAEISGSSIEVSIIPSDLNINYCAKFFATADIQQRMTLQSSTSASMAMTSALVRVFNSSRLQASHLRLHTLW